MTCFTLLGRYDNDTRHRARTIYRGSRTVLQYLEALDILRVDTRNSTGNQGSSITRREVISVHLDSILKNDTVHHPKRLAGTIDRSSTTHTDFRSCTKGTTHVLHAHTSGTAFQATAHISHTRKHGFIRLQLGSCTRKQALILLHHTGNDNLLDLLCITLEGNVDVWFYRNRHRLVTHVGDNQIFYSSRNC